MEAAQGSERARVSATLTAHAYEAGDQYFCRWLGVIHKGV